MKIEGEGFRLKGLFGGLFPKWGQAVEAARLRDEGMAKVIENEDGDWLGKARVWSEQFIASRLTGTFFTGEDVRLFAEIYAGQPGHPNAWGAVVGAAIRKAMKDGVVERAGVTKATRRSSHSRLYPRYLVVRGK